ncbi:hypothetical protein EDD17DRAFT_861688 [Pisolithus thermaeus]|nr:hypothetical protein EV401DRAFT_1182079 [Pisolithus croceorrhizus]KAI6167760.1 hypothetical protein EDD17DRAFT_861688 [Pisolithus thermaeus]
MSMTAASALHWLLHSSRFPSLCLRLTAPLPVNASSDECVAAHGQGYETCYYMEYDTPVGSIGTTFPHMDCQMSSVTHLNFEEPHFGLLCCCGSMYPVIVGQTV